ncbi:tRNA synthetase subunit beta [Methanocalculus chunghsingensis]|uniref:tRNA synthetase subunit beta n=1 Tax=Methanocalculus chunghsingensis TaxID=156457 RepID=A0A8J8B631_9EURY|nr:phenylalanine--tRNA ligase beta subunit-related protein [Methanocalculus chunghsingensis]MBR1369778.1 tRNA synthetase subunit beta [Methanocalculus chunghsingensis]
MHIQKGVETAFPGIGVTEGIIEPLAIQREDPLLESLKEEIIHEIQARYTLERIKDEPLFRAYRDFFWSVGVDPTKTRPASEALVRRILAGKTLPTINTAVDAYNLASARSGIPIAAFDAGRLSGDLTMRFAGEGEEFVGIGMTKPVILNENQVILTDAEAIIAIYPYRDSDATKITIATEAIHLVACGVPKVESGKVARAYEIAVRYLNRYASVPRKNER